MISQSDILMRIFQAMRALSVWARRFHIVLSSIYGIVTFSACVSYWWCDTMSIISGDMVTNKSSHAAINKWCCLRRLRPENTRHRSLSILIVAVSSHWGTTVIIIFRSIYYDMIMARLYFAITKLIYAAHDIDRNNRRRWHAYYHSVIAVK